MGLYFWEIFEGTPSDILVNGGSFPFSDFVGGQQKSTTCVHFACGWAAKKHDLRSFCLREFRTVWLLRSHGMRLSDPTVCCAHATIRVRFACEVCTDQNRKR